MCPWSGPRGCDHSFAVRRTSCGWRQQLLGQPANPVVDDAAESIAGSVDYHDVFYPCARGAGHPAPGTRHCPDPFQSDFAGARTVSQPVHHVTRT